MSHKKPTAIFLFLLLAAAWALSPASEVKATDVSFESCDDFTIDFQGVAPGPGGTQIYSYALDGGNKPLSKLSILEFALDPNLSYQVNVAGTDPTVPANLRDLDCVAGVGGTAGGGAMQ